MPFSGSRSRNTEWWCWWSRRRSIALARTLSFELWLMKIALIGRRPDEIYFVASSHLRKPQQPRAVRRPKCLERFMLQRVGAPHDLPEVRHAAHRVEPRVAHEHRRRVESTDDRAFEQPE